jgi:uncharacterized membrane protein
MIYFLTYLLIYGPPLLVAFLYYRKQKQKQDAKQENNWIRRYLVPFIVFTVTNLLWSLLLYGIFYLFMQA